MEKDPANAAPGSVYRVSDLDLASRLSFFLWSSIPDDELLTLAAAGKLHEPAVLQQQALRMLRDPKSHALVSNFAGQWLQLRNVRNVLPNSDEFPDFDDNLRQAFQRETELFFESILTEDRSVLDLLTADYTFLNERLARHYGISGNLREPVPPRDPQRRFPPGIAGTRQHSGGDLARRAHVAGGARQVDSGKYPGDAGASAAARCSSAQRE